MSDHPQSTEFIRFLRAREVAPREDKKKQGNKDCCLAKSLYRLQCLFAYMMKIILQYLWALLFGNRPIQV